MPTKHLGSEFLFELLLLISMDIQKSEPMLLELDVVHTASNLRRVSMKRCQIRQFLCCLQMFCKETKGTCLLGR